MRRLALLRNGETEAEVIVRYDLAHAKPDVIEREFLEDNELRRHHDTLVEVGIALRLFEIRKGCKPGMLGPYGEEEARDFLCKRLGMSWRNLRRYLRVLRTPIEVQGAFRANQLSLVEAGKVAGLSPQIQAEIASRLRAGQEPRQVLDDYLPKKSNKHCKVGDALAAFRRSLVRGLNDLSGRVASVSAYLVDTMRVDLQRAKHVIDELLAKGTGKGRAGRSDDDEEE
jgi:hypothetical protein